MPLCVLKLSESADRGYSRLLIVITEVSVVVVIMMDITVMLFVFVFLFWSLLMFIFFVCLFVRFLLIVNSSRSTFFLIFLSFPKDKVTLVHLDVFDLT